MTTPDVSGSLKSKKFAVRTLGCKANWVDGQALEAELRKQGWEAAADGTRADVFVINSCTVTDEADRQSRKLAAQLAKRNPGASVVLTGCAVEADPDRARATPGVRFIVGNQDKARFAELLTQRLQSDCGPDSSASATSDGNVTAEVLGGVRSYSEMASRHPMDREWPAFEEARGVTALEAAGQSRRTRVFLKIQDGCNAFCTYCVIPYGRGPARSLAPEKVIAQIQTLIDEQDCQEVVLTGINLGDYGVDRGQGYELPALLRRIFTETRLARLRVGSLDPTEITADMLQLMENEPRFAPHFHVSLQSPHSRILKLMKRKYAQAEVEHTLTSIARLRPAGGEVFMGMDVITGFPGETAEDFALTQSLLKQLPWTRLHVFPYSERRGTPATKLPGRVDPGERAQRARALRELSLERLQARAQSLLERHRAGQNDGGVGPLGPVLMEGRVAGPDASEGWQSGYTPNYFRVLVRTESGETPVQPNQWCRIEPQSLWVDRLAGDVSILGRVV